VYELEKRLVVLKVVDGVGRRKKQEREREVLSARESVSFLFVDGDCCGFVPSSLTAICFSARIM